MNKMQKSLNRRVLGFGLLPLFLSLFLVLGLAFPTNTYAASYGIELTGPSTVRAGDTITLSFKVTGGGLVEGFEGYLTYDTNQVTLTSTKQVVASPWEIEFSDNNFVGYDNKLSSPVTNAVLFTATFKVNANLKTGAIITIGVAEVKVSDGSKDQLKGVSASYTKTIAEPLSTNSYLGSLTVGDGTISPAFDKNTTSYSLSVPYEVSRLSVSGTAEDKKAKVSISSPELVANAYTNVIITVTAENGNTRNYTIRVFREQDPNYIPSTNSLLASLSVEDFFLSPVFDAQRTDYVLWLPYETTALTILAEPQDALAIGAEVRGATELEVGENEILIICTAEDRVTTTTYTIVAHRAEDPDKEPDPPVPILDNCNIISITMEATEDGEKYFSQLFGYNADLHEYTYILEEDIAGISIKAATEDPDATVEVFGNLTLEKGEKSDILIICTAPDGTTTNRYVIHLSRQGEPSPFAAIEWPYALLICVGVCALGIWISLSIMNSAHKKEVKALKEQRVHEIK